MQQAPADSCGSRFSNLVHGLFVAGAGVVAALVLLELGLFLFGHLQNTVPRNSGSRGPADGKRVILCEGDSVTFGLGAPIGESYPVHLEELLNADGDRYRVINKGKIGQNTTMLRENLRAHIRSLKPDIVVVLAGRANVWNLDDYAAYLDDKASFSPLKRMVFGTRIYKLARLLVEDVRRKRRGDPPAAGNASGTAPECYDGEDSVHYQEMRWHINDKAEYERRLQGLYKALQSDPNDEKNLIAAGWVNEALGNYGESTRCFTRAVAANPDNGEGYCGWGTALRGMGRQGEAAGIFRKGLESAPLFAENYVQLAAALQSAGRTEAAVRCLNRGIRAVPRFSGTYAMLGNIHWDEGRLKEAVDCYAKGIAADPENRRNQNYRSLGRLYDGSGKSKDMRRYIANSLSQLKEMQIANPQFKDTCELFDASEEPGLGIERWIKDDLDAIIRICSEEKVLLILQNYPDGAYPRIEGLLARAAADNALPFVDNTAVFNRLAERRTGKAYLTADGHCLTAGNAVLAGNIFRVISRLNKSRH